MSQISAQSFMQSGSSSQSIDPARKRFQNPLLQLPRIVLDPDGTITDVSPSALRLLEYRDKSTINPCFFSHVHGKNLYQVMRDIADMVCYGKPSASWLLRLRTGQGRWRWYKISAKSQLQSTQREIQLTLRDVHEW